MSCPIHDDRPEIAEDKAVTMMIAVQTIRAQTARAPVDAAITVRKALALSLLQRQVGDGPHSSANHKRKLDCWEAYDYQAQMKQQMRCKLLRRDTSCQDNGGTLYRQKVWENPAETDSFERSKAINFEVAKRRRTLSGRTLPITNSNDNLRKQMRRHQMETANNPQRLPRMTKKNYNKKKKLEMMEAHNRHIQNILNQNRSELPVHICQKVRFLRHKAERLNHYLKGQCSNIVDKEKDIKLWLGMTTRNSRKIVKLTKKLHQRWGEVKELQSDVKLYRLRLKSLRYAMVCEGRSIAEDDSYDTTCEQAEVHF